MYSLLLAIIYLAFIGLGLPDSLLGSGWPVIHAELGVPISYAGILTTIIALGTIVSSLASDYVTKKLGAGLVTALSTAVTALALLGFSLTKSFWVMCFLSIPYGLGAGGVDAALNNYVALHYSSRHMSWLHGFWGVGVSISPYIMSISLAKNLGWNMGYCSVSVIQTVLAVIIFMSLPLWKNGKMKAENGAERETSIKNTLKIKGVPYCLIAFFAFCAFEATAGLWASSFFVVAKGIDVKTAASFGALFYLGETAGRFLNGLVADKFGDKTMIKVGILVMIVGVAMMVLTSFGNGVILLSLLVIGLGAAPVYPCIIHSTPKNFGAENSQSLVGIQMASAYVGYTVAPPIFGFLAEKISMWVFPVFLAFFAVLMLLMITKLNKALEEK